MSRVKQASKRKAQTKAVTVLGVAGALSLRGGASGAVGPAGDTQAQNTPPPVITLDEEEISDVSLSTFYVFDHEKRWSTSIRLTTRSEDAQSAEARLRRLRNRLRRRRPHMLRNLRKRRRGGW